MEWSFKKKQEVENLVNRAINNVSFLAVDAAKLPVGDEEKKRQHQERVMESLTGTVSALHTLQDTIVLLGQSLQAQQEAILKTTIAIMGEEEQKPEPIQEKKPYKPENGKYVGKMFAVYLVMMVGFYLAMAFSGANLNITTWTQSAKETFGVGAIVSMFAFIVLSMVFWEDVPPSDDRSKT